MTRKEALEQLRLGPGINEDVSEEYNDAVNMAIKALEQMNAIDKIKLEINLRNSATYMGEYNVGLRDALKIIDKYRAESEGKK